MSLFITIFEWVSFLILEYFIVKKIVEVTKMYLLNVSKKSRNVKQVNEISTGLFNYLFIIFLFFALWYKGIILVKV